LVDGGNHQHHELHSISPLILLSYTHSRVAAPDFDIFKIISF